MTWQEELRRHELSLAEGRITAEEFHRRRDHILAAASSNTSPGDLDPERTQVVTRPAGPVRRPRLPAVRLDPHVRTRPPVTPVTPPQAEELFAAGSRTWPRAVLVLSLAVLLLAAGGVWWFGLSGNDDPAPAATGEPAPPPPTGVERLTLPGTVVPNTGRMSVQRASELQVLLAREADLLELGGVGKVDYNGSATQGYRYLAYAYPSADPTRARTTTDGIALIQEQLGLIPADVGEVPRHVRVSKLTNTDAAVLRGLYTSGSSTIQICVLQVPTGDAAALRAEFLRVLAEVTATIQPDA